MPTVNEIKTLAATMRSREKALSKEKQLIKTFLTLKDLNFKIIKFILYYDIKQLIRSIIFGAGLHFIIII